MQNRLKDEIHTILSGKSEVSYGTTIQAISRYLSKSASTGPGTENWKHLKDQETERLKSYITENDLWIDVDVSQYVSEGAEQKVYLKDPDHVLKLNDAIYYNSWIDYLQNLILHNFFFPDTAYELVGFSFIEEILYAVVKQPFVTISGPTNLEHVKLFMKSNGFTNTRNNDYYNPELGIILEDLHDENVLTKNGVLYFIDTVFYVT